MNSTCKMILLVLSILFTCSSCAKMNLHQPDFPPEDWSISLDLEFSEDYCRKAMSSKDEYLEYYEWNRIEFDLDGEGCLKTNPDHPLVTGKVLKDFRDEQLPVAYLPQRDLERSYEKAFEILNQFDFENRYRSIDPDAPGLDIGLRVWVNGRNISLSFGKTEKIESLPSEVIQLLSIFQRSLPQEYNHFFDFLNVPKLPPLSEKEKLHIQQCKVHKEWMKVDTVKLVFGDFWVGEEFLRTKNRLFPNSNFVYWGGGFGGSERTQTITLYCQSCREAEKKWYEKQGEDFEEVLKEYRQEDF